MEATSKHPSVYIILLNWNNSDETIACLASLEKMAYRNFQVIVVDNGSKDDSVSKINKFYKDLDGMYEVTILQNEENLGFAGGNNTGFKYALEQGADYVLVLNNDTKTDVMFLNDMVQTAEKNEKAGIVGAAIYFYDQQDLIWFGGDTPMKWRLMDKMIASTCDFYKKTMPPEVPAIKVNFITGACMLIKREVLEKINGFDERYFLYFEDADLCFEAQKAGYELWWEPKARIWHKVSATTLPKLGSPRLHYYHVRNVMLLGFDHGPKWLYVYHPLWAGYTLIKQFIKIIIGRKRQISLARVRGILDYYRERFGQYEKIYDKNRN